MPAAFGQFENGKRQNVIYGEKTNLRQFGGPNVDIVIYEKVLRVVDFAVVDNEHEVASAETNINGVSVDPGGYTASVSSESHVVFHPVVTRKKIRLDDGIEVPGTRSEAYLLHEIGDGVKVYFFDAVDVGQNECAILVVAPSATERNLKSVKDRLHDIEELRKSGVISSGEADEKRREVLANL